MGRLAAQHQASSDCGIRRATFALKPRHRKVFVGSVTATNVGLFDLSTPLSNGASAASSPASEKASQAVQGFDIIEISARALELQAAGFDLSTALPNSTSA